MNQEVWSLLREADPARDATVGAGDPDEVLRRAGNDVTTYDAVVPPPHRRAPRLIAVGITVAAVVAGAVAFTLLRPAAGPPATPPPSVAPVTSGAAANCLEELARAVAPTPYDGAGGKYEYLRTRVGSGATVELPGGGFAGATWQEDVRLWQAADGSGRRTSDRTQLQYADNASKQFFQQHPDILGPAGADETMPPGDTLPILPEADPAAMERQLYQPRENGPSQALNGVGSLNRGRVLDAGHRAAVLRFLGGTDGVVCAGRVQTDVGPGLLVTAAVGRGPMPSPGDQGAQVLLFDQLNGELRASGFQQRAGGPIQWNDLFLERGYSNTTG